MKILLLGSNGQLGWELLRTCPGDVDLKAIDHPDADLCNFKSVAACIERTAPDVIINAAAYTAVDKAEQEEKLAYKINAESVGEIAKLCRRENISMVHISTDFIFNGRNYKPYLTTDAPDPESVYGKTKLAGERLVSELLSSDALLIRTAWLYSSNGNNFVKTMLKCMREKPSLNVIDEQVGTPTWANGLAQSIWVSVKNSIRGIYHWTDAGIASWYDFAVAIQEEALQAGLLDGSIPINPVPVDQYPTPAKRPFYSVLDKTSFWRATGIPPVHWRVQLRSMLKELV